MRRTDGRIARSCYGHDCETQRNKADEPRRFRGYDLIDRRGPFAYIHSKDVEAGVFRIEDWSGRHGMGRCNVELLTALEAGDDPYEVRLAVMDVPGHLIGRELPRIELALLATAEKLGAGK